MRGPRLREVGNFAKDIYYGQSKIERGSSPGERLAPRGTGTKADGQALYHYQLGPELILVYGAHRS